MNDGQGQHHAMITLGCDFAAQDANTAWCFIEWKNSAAGIP